jgi:hypothetical protein
MQLGPFVLLINCERRNTENTVSIQTETGDNNRMFAEYLKNVGP